MVRFNHGVEWPLSACVAGRFGPIAASRSSPNRSIALRKRPAMSS